MGREVGLDAVLRPTVDKGQARSEASKLGKMMDDSATVRPTAEGLDDLRSSIRDAVPDIGAASVGRRAGGMAKSGAKTGARAALRGTPIPTRYATKAIDKLSGIGGSGPESEPSGGPSGSSSDNSGPDKVSGQNGVNEGASGAGIQARQASLLKDILDEIRKGNLSRSRNRKGGGGGGIGGSLAAGAAAVGAYILAKSSVGSSIASGVTSAMPSAASLTSAFKSSLSARTSGLASSIAAIPSSVAAALVKDSQTKGKGEKPSWLEESIASMLEGVGTDGGGAATGTMMANPMTLSDAQAITDNLVSSLDAANIPSLSSMLETSSLSSLSGILGTDSVGDLGGILSIGDLPSLTDLLTDNTGDEGDGGDTFSIDAYDRPGQLDKEGNRQTGAGSGGLTAGATGEGSDAFALDMGKGAPAQSERMAERVITAIEEAVNGGDGGGGDTNVDITSENNISVDPKAVADEVSSEIEQQVQDAVDDIKRQITGGPGI